MSESPKDKTSRKIANLLEKYCFECQASVYLFPDSEFSHLEQVNEVKRLIKKDNPNEFMMSFISEHINRDEGERFPYITFYSWNRLTGTLVREKQEYYGFVVAGESKDKPNRKIISHRMYIDQIEGIIKKLRKEKIFDLSLYFGEKKFSRYTLLNKKNEPPIKILAKIQEEYRSRRDSLYAEREISKQMRRR